MSDFEKAQKEIWENTKRQATLAKLCIRGCDWLNEEGICASSTGCMFDQFEEWNE